MQKDNNIKLIISDIDGTLLEYITLKELVTEAITFFGISPKEEYLQMQINGVIEALDEAAKEVIFGFDRLCYYWQKHFTFLNSYGLKVEDIASKMLELEVKYSYPILHVKETLMSLRDDYYKMVCSTNWLLSSQIAKLKALELDSYFDRIYSCEELIAKPNVKHFEDILESENVTPHQAVMIGDSYTDMAASEIGIKTILLDPDNSKQKLYQFSSHVITDLSEIPSLIKK